MKRYNKTILSSLACLIGLIECCPQPKLRVFSQYLTPEDRASYFVVTHEPVLNCPPVGQRVYISWCLSREYLQRSLELKIYLRFRNREQKIVIHPIKTLSGSCVYELLCEEFFKSGGIATYKVELYADGIL